MTTDPTRLSDALSDRYRVERKLGEGGMATVFLAHDLKHDRPVALKVLRPELAAVVGAERFLAEIRTTANLQHPHILPLFDSGEAGGHLFYVMPYVSGGESLRERLERERQLPVGDAVAVATSVAHALDYAHRAGVVHRDVKPANILLQDGEPVVADFGIALAVSESGGGRLTETGLSLGTPLYMSPEQATDDGRIGPATDVYALGCVLHEMLVGEPPYTGATAQAVLGKILTGRLTPPRELRPAVPDNVDAAVRKALERLPADRFATASEFAHALADPGFRHGEAADEAAAGSALRWKAAALGAAAVAVALGAALVLAVAADVSLRGPDPPPAVSTWEVALPDGLALYSGSGVNLDVSPDGSTLAFVGITTDRHIQLWVRRLDQLTPVPVRGTDGGQNPRFSPDGESVAFTAGDALRVTTLTGAPPRTLVSDSVQNIGGLAWGPDGRIYFRKLARGIWRVPVGGGPAEEVTAPAPGERARQWPDVLPDGSGVLHTVDHGGASRDSIAVLSLETGQGRAVLQGAMARYADSGHIVYSSAEGRLMAAPFDADRLEVTGPPRVVRESVEVSDSSAGSFALSRTGVLAYRPGRGVVLGTAGGGGIPVWVSRDGSVEPLDPGLTGLSQAPAISPDGRRVALEHRPEGGARDIWVYDLDQRTLTRTTFGPEGDGRRRPFWRPDGQEIGFRDRPEGGLLTLYAIASDGSEATPRLLRTPEGPGIQEGIWTPDGRGLVYREGALSVVDARFTGDVTILYAPAHPDSVARILVESPFEWYAPSISPDGRWLAYTSHESGRAEVYVRPFPGPGGRELVSDGGGRLPEWTRDGREIVYQALDGPLVVAAVRTEPGFAVLSRERHPEWPEPFAGNPTQHFDTSPDGRILVIDASGVGTRVRDVVVQNFFGELRRRAPE